VSDAAVRELRVAATAPDYDEALAFYRDVLGLREREAFASEDGARGDREFARVRPLLSRLERRNSNR
jgi:catechol 2,3-dioxygenase-like lactoylglutathione lyase family enzyme